MAKRRLKRHLLSGVITEDGAGTEDGAAEDGAGAAGDGDGVFLSVSVTTGGDHLGMVPGDGAHPTTGTFGGDRVDPIIKNQPLPFG